VLDRGYIIRDASGRAYRAVGAISDRTERRRARAEIERMQAELIQVSRLSAMGAMASTLAHELNQPLTAITSYIRGGRRLMEDFAKPGMQAAQEALDAAETAALQAGKIVRHIRQFVARGAVSIRGENLEKLIEDAEILAFVDEHIHGVTHRIEFDPAARWVKVDRIQIQQVLINLIRNGIQAMEESPRREVLITTRAVAGSMAEISVADTGTGLSEDIRDALFLPFRTTKVEGMGIGLSISRTIVEAHGGKIVAEDREGGGTLFRFTLPLAAMAERGES
jgi:two-component system sensor kinase FixL